MKSMNFRFKAPTFLKSIIFISIILVLVLPYGLVIADDFDIPKPSIEFYVYDGANILDSTTEDYIVSVNESLYEKTEAQVVVATVNSLDGRSVDEYAVTMFREWGIGGSEKNNGLLILIAPNEQRLRVEVGYGLEGAIPDGKVGRISDQYLVPAFQEGDYDTGVYNAFNEFIGEIEDEYNVNIDNKSSNLNDDHSTSDGSNEEEGPLNAFFKIIIGIVVVILIILDMIFFRGFFTFTILRMISRGGRGGGNDGNSGGGGSSGGGGASRGW
ncbi:MAG: TPM domain-containing protein [Firmicutes bacterium]|nr:TPM domain-containing protein [Bacillota bacterium]